MSDESFKDPDWLISSMARIAIHKNSLNGKTDNEIAHEMGLFVANEIRKTNCVNDDSKKWYYFELSAQWWEWEMFSSRIPLEYSMYASSQRILAFFIRNNSEKYKNIGVFSSNNSCWGIFMDNLRKIGAEEIRRLKDEINELKLSAKGQP